MSDPDAMLKEAVRRKDPSKVEEAVQAGASINLILPGLKRSHLFGACVKNDLPTVVELLRCGADVDLGSTVLNQSPLTLACFHGNDLLANVLVAHGADVNHSHGAPLAAASTKGHAMICRLLLANGADANLSPTGVAPLIGAIANVRLECARVLLDDGGVSADAVGPTGLTGLMVACTVDADPARQDRLEALVQCLLDHGANPAAAPPAVVDEYAAMCWSHGLLGMACRNGLTGAAAALLKDGRVADDVSKVGPDGATVLHVAAENLNADLVALLAEHGADPSVVSVSGTTPLQAAAFAADSEATVAALIAAGADVNAVGADGGDTALARAAAAGCMDSVVLLMTAGARVEDGAVAAARSSGHADIAAFLALAKDASDADASDADAVVPVAITAAPMAEPVNAAAGEPKGQDSPPEVDPPAPGRSPLVYIVPAVAVVAGIAGYILWSRKK